MNEVKNPETQLRCGYALRRVARPAIAYLGGLKSTACAVSTPYGVERNLRLLYLGA